MLHKHLPRQPTRPYNAVVRAGVWVTVISALLWAGGRLINKIAFYLPYALGVGIGLMLIGLIIQFQMSRAAKEERRSLAGEGK